MSLKEIDSDPFRLPEHVKQRRIEGLKARLARYLNGASVRTARHNTRQPANTRTAHRGASAADEGFKKLLIGAAIFFAVFFGAICTFAFLMK